LKGNDTQSCPKLPEWPEASNRTIPVDEDICSSEEAMVKTRSSIVGGKVCSEHGLFREY